MIRSINLIVEVDEEYSKEKKLKIIDDAIDTLKKMFDELGRKGKENSYLRHGIEISRALRQEIEKEK